MRTVTTEQTIYEFNELSDAAQARALDAVYRINAESGYSWQSECVECLRDIGEYLGVTPGDWTVEPGRYDYTIDGEDVQKAARGFRLSVGVKRHPEHKQCADDSMPGAWFFAGAAFWGAFIAHAEKQGDINGAIRAGFDALFKAWADDIEYQESARFLTEEAENYEFTEDGEIYQ